MYGILCHKIEGDFKKKYLTQLCDMAGWSYCCMLVLLLMLMLAMNY